MSKIEKEFDPKIFFSFFALISLLIFFWFFLGVRFQEIKREQLIKNGERTIATFVSSTPRAPGRSGSHTFEYEVDGIKYKFGSDILIEDKSLPITVAYCKGKPEKCILIPFEPVNFNQKTLIWRSERKSEYSKLLIPIYINE